MAEIGRVSVGPLAPELLGVAFDRFQDQVRAQVNPSLSKLGTLAAQVAALLKPFTWLTVGGSGVPFAANWGNFGGGYAVAAYGKDALGWMHGKGVVAPSVNQGANVAIFTLPAGNRPKEIHQFVGKWFNGASDVSAIFQIFPSGVISFETAVTTAETVAFEFTFLAEQ